MVDFFTSFLIGIVVVVALLATLMVSVIVGSNIRDAKKRRAVSEAEFKEKLEYMGLHFKSFLDSGGEIVRADGGYGRWENFVLRHGFLELRISNYMGDWEVRCHPTPFDEGTRQSGSQEEVSIPLHSLAEFLGEVTPQEAARNAAKEIAEGRISKTSREKIEETARLVEEVLEPAQAFFDPKNLEQRNLEFDSWFRSRMEVVRPVYEKEFEKWNLGSSRNAKPNTSFQRTRVRGGRGPGPLNSNR